MSSRRRLLTGLLFVLPWLAGFVLLTLWPFVVSLYWSLCRYDLLSPPRWVGLAHYQRLLHETVQGDEFGQALWNTAYYAALVIPGSVLCGVGLALLLHQDTRFVRAVRATVFFPSIVPTVAASIVWIWLFDPTRGTVNALLGQFGMQPAWFNSAAEGLNPVDWMHGGGFGSKDALALMSLWGAGQWMVIYLGGLNRIPKELYEAARLDGAGSWSRFRHVTLPLLTPVIFFNIVMGLVASVQYFTPAYVVSGGTGGPDGSTRVLSLHVFLWAFKYFEAGYASAAAWLLFVVIMTATALLFGSANRWVHYRGE